MRVTESTTANCSSGGLYRPKRCQRVGSTHGRARIALNGFQSFARLGLRWRSGPAILQILSFQCRRDRFGPDANCNSGRDSVPSDESYASDYNNGAHNLPVRGRGVRKENMEGNKYFYEFRFKFRALETRNTRDDGKWSYPDESRPRYSHSFECDSRDCEF